MVVVLPDLKMAYTRILIVIFSLMRLVILMVVGLAKRRVV
tara:strand:+ start:443 stop:562 length:120 start_codon:yes stop_codon:yes gene_type:complete